MTNHSSSPDATHKVALSKRQPGIQICKQLSLFDLMGYSGDYQRNQG